MYWVPTSFAAELTTGLLHYLLGCTTLDHSKDVARVVVLAIKTGCTPALAMEMCSYVIQQNSITVDMGLGCKCR